MAFIIKTITVFVAIDPKTGDEGVMATQLAPGQWMPLVCADSARIASMLPVAEQIRIDSGAKYRILQFSEITDITDYIKNTSQ